MQAMKPYTVVGVTSGPECLRVHQNVLAETPEHAVCDVVNQLNGISSMYEKGSFEARLKDVMYNTPIQLTGALVFEGHLDNFTEHRENALRGHDRPFAFDCGCAVSHKPFTVVTVDPASHQVSFHHVEHTDSANAERNPAFEFFLVGGVVSGHVIPAYVHQTVARAWSTSRDQRVMALVNKYSLEYLRNLSYHHQPAFA